MVAGEPQQEIDSGALSSRTCLVDPRNEERVGIGPKSEIPGVHEHARHDFAERRDQRILRRVPKTKQVYVARRAARGVARRTKC